MVMETHLVRGRAASWEGYCSLDMYKSMRGSILVWKAFPGLEKSVAKTALEHVLRVDYCTCQPPCFQPEDSPFPYLFFSSFSSFSSPLTTSPSNTCSFSTVAMGASPTDSAKGPQGIGLYSRFALAGALGCSLTLRGHGAFTTIWVYVFVTPSTEITARQASRAACGSTPAQIAQTTTH